MKKLIIGLGGCGNNIVNLVQDQIDDSYKTLSIQRDLQLLAISKADFKLNPKEKDFEEKLNIILNFSDNVFLVAGLGGSTLFLYIQILLKLIKKNKKLVTLYLTSPNSIESLERLELSNQTNFIVEKIPTISYIFKNDKYLSEIDDEIIDKLLKQEIDLFEIIKRIEVEKWCFNYGGACGTCGMIDVKNYLKQFKFEEIISLYKNLDYANLCLDDNQIEAIAKIYSLLTSNYSVYKNTFNFKEFEKELIDKYPHSQILLSLVMSNNNTYWNNREKERNRKIQIEFDRTLDREIEMERYAILKSKDKKLQDSEYRKHLIENLKTKDIKDIIEYLAEDEEHTIKFYPSILVVEAEDKLEAFNKDHLRKILDKLSLFDARRSPWKRFKKKLRWYLNGKEWYEK